MNLNNENLRPSTNLDESNLGVIKADAVKIASKEISKAVRMAKGKIITNNLDI
ncbi:hypothetical protein [Maribacter flavus]|uniref:hypothetical protein n=1 Tax=Maribacter flavus TaxID=1658664 RepID=UPI001375D850|nr:hypothetical protein [Maribacter flavus]